LFELEISGLEKQKRTREFELLVQTCIMNTIRDKIPIESLLRQYMDESSEIEVKVDKPKEDPKIEAKVEPKLEPKVLVEPKVETNVEPVCEAVKFDDIPVSQPVPLPVSPPLPEPETRPSISFNPSIESFDLPEEEGFSIGEDVPINTMNFTDLEPIDLGIIEL
jgi:hypothetical protein